MSLEAEIVALRDAIDRLTQAVHGHAATRLAIFERAGQEALAAIPLVPGEDATAVINPLAVPFTHPTSAAASTAELNPFSDLAAANQPADEPPPLTVSYDQARELGLTLLKTGRKADQQEILDNRLGAGSIDQLTDAQRVTFATLVNGALREAA
jgi:hypothetical protein